MSRKSTGSGDPRIHKGETLDVEVGRWKKHRGPVTLHGDRPSAFLTIWRATRCVALPVSGQPRNLLQQAPAFLASYRLDVLRLRPLEVNVFVAS